MSAFYWFDRVLCVSHPITARRPAMERQLLDHGMVAEFVYAARPAAGFTMSNMRRNSRTELACSLSHYKALLRAATGGYKRPLVLEDDVEFGDYAHLDNALARLPTDWAVLYLGGHPCEPVEPVSEHLVRVGRFSFAEAYSISGAHLRPFLEYWLDRIGQPQAMFDRVLGEYARDHGGYAVKPTVTTQPPGYSHIAMAHDDKRELVRRGWANNS